MAPDQRGEVGEAERAIELRIDSVEFWCMVPIVTIRGVIVAYPVNWWRIRTGFTETM